MKENTYNQVNKFSFARITDSVRIFMLYVSAFIFFIPAVIILSLAGFLSVFPELFKNSASDDDWEEHQRLSHFYTARKGESNDRL